MGGPLVVVLLALQFLVAVEVLARLMVDDFQNLDEPERGPQPAEGCLLIRVDVRHTAMMYAAMQARRCRPPLAPCNATSAVKASWRQTTSAWLA